MTNVRGDTSKHAIGNWQTGGGYTDAHGIKGISELGEETSGVRYNSHQHHQKHITRFYRKFTTVPGTAEALSQTTGSWEHG